MISREQMIKKGNSIRIPTNEAVMSKARFSKEEWLDKLKVKIQIVAQSQKTTPDSFIATL